MEPLVLKKSCDSCTHSKVKCSGGYPCERCVQKLIQCFYSPRKKRVRPKKPKTSKPTSDVTTESQADINDEDVIISRSSFDPTVPLGSLVDWERRSWSVFFTLYKHYGTSCSLHWFNRQLNKMRNYLLRQGNTESLRRLTAWMEALSIDVDGLAAQVEKCRIRCFVDRQLSFQVKGKVKDQVLERKLRPILQQNNPDLPFLKMTTSYSPNLEEDDVTLEVNNAFQLIFGVSEKALREQLRWTAGGFLPWAGDVLSRLLTQEKDLLAFVQILAIKFNSLGKPDCTTLPLIRDVPSCHMFELNIKQSATSSALVPVTCLVKCMHREIITEEKSLLEISMEFTPLSHYEHLLKQADLKLLTVDKEVTVYGSEEKANNLKRKSEKKHREDSENESEYETDTDSEQDENEEEFELNKFIETSSSSFYSSSNGSEKSKDQQTQQKSASIKPNKNVLSFDDTAAALAQDFFPEAKININAQYKKQPAQAFDIDNSDKNSLTSKVNMASNFEIHSDLDSVFDDAANMALFALPNLTDAETNNESFGQISSGASNSMNNINLSGSGRNNEDEEELNLNDFLNTFASSDNLLNENLNLAPTNRINNENNQIENNNSNNNNNNNIGFFEEQAEWLDGLLDWAKTQELDFHPNSQIHFN